MIGARSSTGNISGEDILPVLLQEYKDVSTLTAKNIRSSLEAKCGLDLSGQEHVIQQVLQRVQASKDSEEVRGSAEGRVEVKCGDGETEQPQTSMQSKPRAKKPRQQQKRKQSFLHPKSDDEADEDFDPHQHAKKKSNKK